MAKQPTDKSHITVAVVFGTRPEAIKLCPLILSLRTTDWCRVHVVVTGQHREMLDQVLQMFELTPDVDLDLYESGQSLNSLASKIHSSLDSVFSRTDLDAVIVQGDTTTTSAAALAAFYREVPVIHVEAGLRSNDRWSPFPEEVNRRIVTQVATLHLAATQGARDNLRREHVDEHTIVVTGNTVIDALGWAIERASALPLELAHLEHLDRPLLLVTAHRRESWGDGMVSIGRALRRIALKRPDVAIVFPMHRNPLVRGAIAPQVEDLANVTLCEPLAYAEFSALLTRTTVALTDSGGVQEEAPALGIPVLVMRDTTERPEGVSAGTVELVGTNEEKIVARVLDLLRLDEDYARMSNAANPYGDGRACLRSVAAIGNLFARCERMPDFC